MIYATIRIFSGSLGNAIGNTGPTSAIQYCSVLSRPVAISVAKSGWGKMAVSERNRTRFSAIGLDAVRREVVTGTVTFLGISDDERAQAREWVEQQEAELRRREEDRQALDERRFQIIRRWTIIAAVAGAAAAITGAAALLK
jgi:hypothetical protein